MLLGYKDYKPDLQVFKVLSLLSSTGHQGISPLCPFFHYAFSAQGQFLLPLSASLPCTWSEIQSFQWQATLSIVSFSSLGALGSLPEVIPSHHLLMYCLWPALLSKKKWSLLELSSIQFQKTLPALVGSRTLSWSLPVLSLCSLTFLYFSSSFFYLSEHCSPVTFTDEVKLNFLVILCQATFCGLCLLQRDRHFDIVVKLIIAYFLSTW